MTATLEPRLVLDKETGKLCLQVRLGSHSATHELPESFEDWDPRTKEIHITGVVTEMVSGLQLERAEEQKKLRRRFS